MSMKPRHLKIILMCILFSFTAVFFQNCGQAGDILLATSESGSTLKNGGDDETTGKTPDVPLYTPPVVTNPPTIDPNLSVAVSELKGYICEPFANSEESSNGRNGLKASLRYVTPSTNDDLDFAKSLGAKNYWSNTSSLISKYDNPIFFKDINVAPTAFDAGFFYAPGKYLEDKNNQKLIEWFSVKYETLLQLSTANKPGYYKLASVSDDGTIVEADVAGDGKMVEVLNNDGTHSTRFQCQKDKSYLYFPTQDSKIKFNLYFYQGPRVHITNVLMFKYVGATLPSDDNIKGCELNGSGNTFTGNSNVTVNKPAGNTTALKANDPNSVSGEYAYLIDNGWSIIPNRNYLLPGEEIDPCAVNSLTILSSSDPQYMIAGKKVIVNNAVSLKFVSSLPSDHVVKFYEISSTGTETLMNNASLGSSSVVNEKNVHSIQFNGIMAGNKYRIEININNSSLNIFKRTDFLVSP
jgi:hypothetical protein